jgi:hypothetical protein
LQKFRKQNEEIAKKPFRHPEALLARPRGQSGGTWRLSMNQNGSEMSQVNALEKHGSNFA